MATSDATPELQDSAARLNKAMDAVKLNQTTLAESVAAAEQIDFERARQDINKAANAKLSIGPTLARRWAPHLGVEPEQLLTAKPAKPETTTDGSANLLRKINRNLEDMSSRLANLEDIVDQVLDLNTRAFRKLAPGVKPPTSRRRPQARPDEHREKPH